MLKANSHLKPQPQDSPKAQQEKPRTDREPLALDVEILEERIAPAADYLIKIGSWS